MKTYTKIIPSKGLKQLSYAIAYTLAMIFIFNTAVFAQPAVPTLSSPVDSAEFQPHSLTLLWNVSANAESYQLQVSSEEDFSSTVFNETGLTDSAQFVEDLSFSTMYYWRVAATNGTGTSDYSTVFTFTTWDSIPKGPALVDLGMAAEFAILAHTAVTNVPSSAILGDVGLSPASGSFIDLTEDEVTGTIYTVDASGPAGSVEAASMLTEAKDDLTTAYNDAAGRTVAPIGIAGNIGGQTLYPGLYKSTGTLEISAGDLTLDGGGHDDAVWIFQIASSFNMTSDRKVFLINGANAANIFWQVGSAASFGTTSVMKGTIMAATQVTLATGATLDGQAMALTENVTLQQNAINLPEGSVSTSNEVSDSQLPSKFTLSQNYPNPFNPTTNIRFGLNEASDVRLEIFNMLGQSMVVLVNERKAAGWHNATFDASSYSSGMYIYQITANGIQSTKRMMLIK
ncbi:MAG: ice-binding family protein [Gracilimonas sp.]